MTPEQATLVQDAAGLVAAHLRRDEEAQGVLLESYCTPGRFPALIEAFVFYTAAAVQISAQLTQTSWASVLESLPRRRVGLIPGVDPDWNAARQLVANLIDTAGRDLPVMEVTSCVEAAYALAVSITHVLAADDDAEALGWTVRISVIAAREN